jgi:hypothetical protein
MVTRQLNHEPIEVLSSGSHTPAGIDTGLDASGVTQRMRDARLSRYQALRGRHQSKSTDESIEAKSTGDLHAVNPRRHEVLGNRDVCSTLYPTRIGVGPHGRSGARVHRGRTQQPPAQCLMLGWCPCGLLPTATTGLSWP